MLNAAATYLEGRAEDIASSRNALNSACYGAEDAFADSYLKNCFNEFFTAWFSALDAQAETLASAADATQQCAVRYDHANREALASIPAMPTKKVQYAKMLVD
jgi:uncharacterized protein YukE